MSDQAVPLPKWLSDCGIILQKDSLITHIVFELCLFRYLAQSTYFWDTLYYVPIDTVKYVLLVFAVFILSANSRFLIGNR